MMKTDKKIIMLIISAVLFLLGIWPIAIILITVAITLLVTDSKNKSNENKEYDPEIKK